MSSNSTNMENGLLQNNIMSRVTSNSIRAMKNSIPLEEIEEAPESGNCVETDPPSSLPESSVTRTFYLPVTSASMRLDLCLQHNERKQKNDKRRRKTD